MGIESRVTVASAKINSKCGRAPQRPPAFFDWIAVLKSPVMFGSSRYIVTGQSSSPSRASSRSISRVTPIAAFVSRPRAT